MLKQSPSASVISTFIKHMQPFQTFTQTWDAALSISLNKWYNSSRIYWTWMNLINLRSSLIRARLKPVTSSLMRMRSCIYRDQHQQWLKAAEPFRRVKALYHLTHSVITHRSHLHTHGRLITNKHMHKSEMSRDLQILFHVTSL